MHNSKQLFRTFCLAVFCLAWPAFAYADADSDAVSDVAKQFKSSGDYEWFDSEKDQIRARNYGPIPADDPFHRGSEWETDVVRDVKSTGPSATSDSLFLNILAWFLVVVLIVGVVSGLLWGLLRQDDEETVTEIATEAEQETEAERVERLPFHIQAAQTDLLGEVRRHAEQMDYAKATVYFYSFLLVELDKYQVIRLEPGKTNRMYLRDVSAYPQLGGVLAATVSVFEDAFFGNHEIERERFEQCWNQLPAFQHFLAQGGRA